jgi:hypothetical protein
VQITKENTISKDIDGIDLFNDLISYRILQNGRVDPLEIFECIVKNDLKSFPNLFIALRISFDNTNDCSI